MRNSNHVFKLVLTLGCALSCIAFELEAVAYEPTAALKDTDVVPFVGWNPTWNNKETCIPPKLEFIHIGKCGGTFLNSWMRRNHFSLWCLFQTHTKKVVEANAHDREMYLIWLREPLQRYRSAYEFECAVATTDLDTMIDANGRVHLCRMGPKCLAPMNLYNNALILQKLRAKAKAKAALEGSTDYPPVSPENIPGNYAATVCKTFSSANDLAEGLSLPMDSERGAIARKAFAKVTHLRCGIGYYLDGGDFIKRHHRKIFVGRLETQHDDLIRLERVLGLQTADNPANSRQMHNASYHVDFSEKAKRNLRAQYATDYEAIRQLQKHGLISVRAMTEYNTTTTATTADHDEKMLLDDGEQWLLWNATRNTWISTDAPLV
eukprot:m.52781 g.52781  ORF g.52781 m.52781 type:complete len:378 (-) comp21656_c1_seq1:145-1278(-)